MRRNAFIAVAFFITLTLKLSGIGMASSFSWWWVFAPLWIPIAILSAIFIVEMAIAWVSK